MSRLVTLVKRVTSFWSYSGPRNANVAISDPVLTPVTTSKHGRVPVAVQPLSTPTVYAPYFPPPDRARYFSGLPGGSSPVLEVRDRSAYDRSRSVSVTAGRSSDGVRGTSPLARLTAGGGALRCRVAH